MGVKNFLKKYLYVLVLLIGSCFLLMIGTVNANGDRILEDSLPVLEISLKDITIEELHTESKDNRYTDSQVTVRDPQSGNHYTISGVEVKGRGNSSWKMPKRSYQIKFEQDISLLNMEPAKSWLLIANYADASLMRNKLMYDLAGEMMDYVQESCYVDLWIEGEYLGNYLLCEKVQVSDGRVALKDNDGLLVEVDNIYFYESEERFQSPISGSHFILKDSKANDLEKEDSAAREAFAEFESYIQQFESLLYAEEKEWSAIRELIDVESFVKYYFIEELAENSDSCRTSIYMYKDGAEDQLHMGPVWDFDKAVGYSQRGKYGGDTDADYVANIQEYMGNTKELTWYMELFKIPEFQEEAHRIYQEQIKEIFSTTGEKINTYQSEIQDSANRNYERWDISGIPEVCDHDPYRYTNWEDSVEDLKIWTEERVTYLSGKYR